MNYLLDLKTLKIRFYFKAIQPIMLPDYKGAAFRGLFGHTFKKVACANRSRNCGKCGLASNCVYYYIFETPFNKEVGTFSAPKAPQPFIIEPMITTQREFPPDEKFTMDLVLIGRAIEYTPYFIYTFDEMSRTKGIGKWKNREFGKFKLEKADLPEFQTQENFNVIYKNGIMYAENMPTDYPPIDAQPELPQRANLMINFITQTKIKHNGSLVEYKNKNPFDFTILMKNIFRRAYLLHVFHQDEALPEFYELEVDPIPIAQKNLNWKSVYHYSNRQRSRSPISGFLGSVMFENGWQSYYPLIQLGEQIHIGKETTFGLGKYKITIL
jgi:hypothetical protein